MDLTLNNQQWLMCHQTKPHQVTLLESLSDTYHLERYEPSISSMIG